MLLLQWSGEEEEKGSWCDGARLGLSFGIVLLA